MATISPAQITDGETIDASDVNNPINTIANEINGSLDNDNISATAGIDSSKISTTVTSWTPTWTNLTVGNGTYTSQHYTQIGKLITYNLHFILGSTSSISGVIEFSIPTTANTNLATGGNTGQTIGSVKLIDAGTEEYLGQANLKNTTTARVTVWNTASTFSAQASTGATNPFTWTTGDAIDVTGFYWSA